MLVYFNDFQVLTWARTHHFHSGDSPKDAFWSKTLDLYQELKSVLIGQSSLTIKGYFCGKCYDSAWLVGHYLVYFLHIATFWRLSFHRLVKPRCFTSLWTFEFKFTILWNICVFFFTNISVWMSGGVHCGGVLLSTVAKEKEVSGGNFQDFFHFWRRYYYYASSPPPLSASQA